MSTNTLLGPFENVSDPDEQIVLATLAHLAPTLEAWRAGEDCRLELEELAQEVPRLEARSAALEGELDGLRLERQAERQALSRRGPALLYGGGAVLVIGAGLLLAATVAGGASLVVAGLLAALAGGGAAVAGIARIRATVAGIDASIGALGQESERTRTSLDAARQRIVELETEIGRRRDAFPDVTITRGDFRFAARKLLDRVILLDESGHFSAALETVDLSPVCTDLDQLTARIAELETVPVLLSADANERSDGQACTLYGEERELHALVEAFSASLAQVRRVSLALPLVPADHPVARAFATAQGRTIDYGEGALLPVRSASVDEAEVARFMRLAQTTRTGGDRVIGAMGAVVDGLQRVTGAYAAARSDSLARLHAGLFEVLDKGSWCGKRFYCPRTIQSPAYLQHALGLDVQAAHEEPFETLIGTLRSDPVIAARFDARPTLRDELYAAYVGIHELQGRGGAADRADAPGAEADAGAPAYLRDQRLEAIERFRQMLTMTLTGATQPVLEFSESARLHLDPDRNEWRSDAAPYVYATADVLRFGQVPRVTSDLLIPLWEHLWVEKDDFRKSELFRTNEMLLSMSEKEAEKLIAIGDQFRADMRTVRENVFHIEAELSSKYDELRAFREGMASLGLLSERQQAFLSDDSLKAIALGDASVVRRADDLELVLGQEPRAQAERRGSVQDPIDAIRSPAALIGERPSNAGRRLVAA